MSVNHHSNHVTRAEICATAIADAFIDDGEILASPIGNLPAIGVRLAKATSSPQLLMTDGLASLVDGVQPWGIKKPKQAVVEGWMPYRSIFDLVLSGRRHVMMGASQIDQFGNQNISLIGEFRKPTSQLLGVRGAPSNTISHKTSYWIPRHNLKSFVDTVDIVSGVGYDRAKALSRVNSQYHNIHRVITNLAVMDFETRDNKMRLRSLHPGVKLEDVVKNTGFKLHLPEHLPESRIPTDDELTLLRETIDPNNFGQKEVPG